MTDSTMGETILAESFNAQSGRHAILACDNNSAWLYMHEPTQDENELAPVESSGFAFNLIPPITRAEINDFRPSPPIVDEFASAIAVIENPTDCTWRMQWSSDGSAVYVSRDGFEWCALTPEFQMGLSRSVELDGPWGMPWQDDVFDKIEWTTE